MRISEVATAGQGSGFRSRHDHAGGKGSGSGLDVTESLAPSLREQLSRARAWWLKDQAEGRSGVTLPDALERKYPRAGHSWPWFWVFAQHTHSTDPRSGVVRRLHV